MSTCVSFSSFPWQVMVISSGQVTCFPPGRTGPVSPLLDVYIVVMRRRTDIFVPLLAIVMSKTEEHGCLMPYLCLR